RRFLEQACREQGRSPVPTLSQDGVAALEGYAWPGNVRELRNVMTRALLLDPSDEILPLHLPVKMKPPSSGAAGSPPLDLRCSVKDEERKVIILALERCKGNQTHAARLLGISRRTLINKLDRYGIARPLKGGRGD